MKPYASKQSGCVKPVEAETRKMKKRSVVLLQRVEGSIRIEPYFRVGLFSVISEESNVWLFEPNVSKETCGFFFTSVISI